MSHVLKYEVRQIYLQDKGLYYLPIPKLNTAQFDFIAEDLRARGYSVTRGRRINARIHGSSFALSQAGLAWSSSELLDAVVPSVARVLGFSKQPSKVNPYFVTKSGGSVEVQFFPRLEGLGHWTSLRRQDECGLTPDEALILRRLLGDSKAELECLTDYPVEGCRPMQVGRHQYYHSRVSSAEFLSNLRTISKKRNTNCYLPRTSVLKAKRIASTDDASLSGELGEWCFLELPP